MTEEWLRMNRLSIAICIHNEGQYVEDLLERVVQFKRNTKLPVEIVIVDDFSTEEKTIRTFEKYLPYIKLYTHALNNDFATHKNFMNSQCNGEYILNLDADEMVSMALLHWIPELVEMNYDVDAFWLPRRKYCGRIDRCSVQQWGWQLTNLPEFSLPLVQWPDPQMRLYRNAPDIRWVNKVHEQLTGYKNFAAFPFEPDYAIIHHKDIQRQEQQNTLYSQIKK
jgi:glycosyltransferase involved in cell wall biosynthesis